MIWKLFVTYKKRIETSVCPKSDEEIENIYLALVYRQAFWQNGYVDSINEKNLQFYQDMTERAFQRIKNDYKVDLFQDDILVNGLVLHLASNFSRYLLGMETENLFYNDVLKVIRQRITMRWKWQKKFRYGRSFH